MAIPSPHFFSLLPTSPPFSPRLVSRYPSAKFSHDHANVGSAFAARDLIRAAAMKQQSSLTRADVVVVQYQFPTGLVPGYVDVSFEKFVRYLLTLPRKPVVLYVSHCAMSDFR